MSEMKKCQIQFRVTEKELAQIKENAGDRSLSDYLRTLALSGSHPVVFEICTDDLDELGYIVSDKLDRFETYVRILGREEKLSEGELERMETLLEDIRDEFHATVSTVLKTRVSVRNAVLREFRKLYKEAEHRE